MSETQSDALKSLRKGLDVLSIFRTSDHDELSLTEIADLSGLSNATVSRTLRTLVEAGFLAQRESRGKYSLGTVYLEFSGRIKQRLTVRNVALPYVTALNRIVKEAIILTAWNGNAIALNETFDQVTKPGDPLKIVPSEGTRLSLHATSPGKVILADFSEEDLHAYLLSSEMRPYTPRTITDPEELRAHLAAAKANGVAFDYEEYRLGVTSLAAGIRNADHKLLGTVTIVAPSVRFDQTRVNQLVPTLKNCTLQISADLGFVNAG